MKRSLVIEIELDAMPPGTDPIQEMSRQLLEASGNVSDGKAFFRMKTGDVYTGTCQIVCYED